MTPRWWLLLLSLLWLTPPVGAAERLRIVEEHGLFIPGDRGPHRRVLVDLTGRTAAQRALIARLWTKHAADFPPEHRFFAVPDAGGTRIELEHAGQSLTLFSSHPGFESNAGLVATSHGIEMLEGRARKEVIRAQPAWFQRFRAAFDAILAAGRAFREPSS